MSDKEIREYSPEEADRFYDGLRKKIAGYTGRFSEWVLLVPDIFMLLVRLNADARVPGKYKALLLAGIAYFISPVDILPELVLGPFGYLDDLVVGAYILDKLLSSVPPEVVLSHWSGESDLLDSIKSVISKANHLLGDKLDMILKKFNLN